MTPQEQAEAILKAAEEATPGPWDCGRDPSHYDAPEITKKDGAFYVGVKMEDAAFIALARNTAPSIASALLEKHKALEAAEAHIQILLDIFEPIPGSETSLDDKRMIREARAFLSRMVAPNAD